MQPSVSSAASASKDAKDAHWRNRLQASGNAPLTPDEASAFATFALDRVSRTFALNIRALPEPLRDQVLHAYLYCRMADTLEDDAELPAAQKAALLQVFAALFNPELPPHLRAAMSSAFPPMLPEEWHASTAWEKILLVRTPLLLEAFSRVPEASRRTIARCVRSMCGGMGDFAMRQEAIQRQATAQTTAQTTAQAIGQPARALIETVADLDHYCWFVAGTVGEMLCDLFIAHGRIPERRAAILRALGVSFGTGLQLVNILKDHAEDGARGVSWLPGAVVAERGAAATQRLLCLKAMDHLQEALTYTLAIPRRHRGLRLFCLWPLLMASETLALIANHSVSQGANPGTNPSANPAANRSETPLKINRARVARIVGSTSLLWWADGLLRAEFEQSARQVRAALQVPPTAHTFADTSGAL